MAAIKVMPFCCAVLQVFAVLCFDKYVSQHAVRVLFSFHSVCAVLFSNMLWEVHFFWLMFALCCSNPTIILFPPLDIKSVSCGTEVPWPTLPLHFIETLAVDAETADLVSALCHCAACLCWNYASKGWDRWCLLQGIWLLRQGNHVSCMITTVTANCMRTSVNQIKQFLPWHWPIRIINNNDINAFKLMLS